MQIIRFDAGDELQLKKKHPCGCDIFKVLRGGTDVRLVCTGCGRDLTMSRQIVEKAIKKVLKNS